MTVTNDSPTLTGLQMVSLDTLTPTTEALRGVLNSIPPRVTTVRLLANVAAATDIVYLPALADVPNGHTIQIIAGSVGCEIRTPFESTEEINSENCDGTKEYALPATEIHEFKKIDNTIGWMGHGYTALGARATVVVPD